MGRTFIAGGALLAAAGVAILLDSLLGLGLGSVLLGIAIGGALSLAEGGSAIGRLGSFLVGFVVAIVAYLLRVLVLNGSPVGLFVFAAFVIAAVTTVSALTGNRLPLWAGLLGVVAVVAVYENPFLDSPQNIESELISAASTVLVPISLGFLAGLLAKVPDEGRGEPVPAEWESEHVDSSSGVL